jgi:hypothetical protein
MFVLPISDSIDVQVCYVSRGPHLILLLIMSVMFLGLYLILLLLRSVMLEGAVSDLIAVQVCYVCTRLI